MNVKKWLTEGEKDTFDKDRSLTHVLTDRKDIELLANSLAAERELSETRRALLARSHSFIKWLNEQTAWQTMSPHRDIGTLVKDIAAALKGVGGE